MTPEEADRLQGALAVAQAELEVARAHISALEASFSWRVTRPVRAVSTVLRRMLRPGPAPETAPPSLPPPGAAETAAPPPAPADPNEPYLFKPVASAGFGTGTVTIEELYTLSRSL